MEPNEYVHKKQTLSQACGKNCQNSSFFSSSREKSSTSPPNIQDSLENAATLLTAPIGVANCQENKTRLDESQGEKRKDLISPFLCGERERRLIGGRVKKFAKRRRRGKKGFAGRKGREGALPA